MTRACHRNWRGGAGRELFGGITRSRPVRPAAAGESRSAVDRPRMAGAAVRTGAAISSRIAIIAVLPVIRYSAIAPTRYTSAAQHASGTTAASRTYSATSPPRAHAGARCPGRPGTSPPAQRPAPPPDLRTEVPTSSPARPPSRRRSGRTSRARTGNAGRCRTWRATTAVPPSTAASANLGAGNRRPGTPRQWRQMASVVAYGAPGDQARENGMTTGRGRPGDRPATEAATGKWRSNTG